MLSCLNCPFLQQVCSSHVPVYVLYFLFISLFITRKVRVTFDRPGMPNSHPVSQCSFRFTHRGKRELPSLAGVLYLVLASAPCLHPSLSPHLCNGQHPLIYLQYCPYALLHPMLSPTKQHLEDSGTVARLLLFYSRTQLNICL